MGTASAHVGEAQERARILRDLGARGGVVEELLAYNRNPFRPDPGLAGMPLPLADEPFMAAWRDYARAAAREDAIAVLRRAWVQLAFPLRPGIAHEPAYRAVCLGGAPPAECPLATGLPLARPEDIELRLVATAAGHLPIVVIPHRGDFEAILRACTGRNEPAPVAPALGAMIVSGYTNWDRVARYREAWLVSHNAADWGAEFARLASRKELYQDRFVLVSRGPYSGVSAADLGLEEHAWERLSLDIRIHHECAHYGTKRLLGSMRNNLLDELIADYLGLTGACGRFRADWFLRFMGLEDFPAYRPGGRLEAYRGDPPLSDGAFAVVSALVAAAARQLERFDRVRGGGAGVETAGRLIRVLAGLSLEELAAEGAWERLAVGVGAAPAR